MRRRCLYFLRGHSPKIGCSCCRSIVVVLQASLLCSLPLPSAWNGQWPSPSVSKYLIRPSNLWPPFQNLIGPLNLSSLNPLNWWLGVARTSPSAKLSMCIVYVLYIDDMADSRPCQVTTIMSSIFVKSIFFFSFFFKINDLLHGARRQAVADTLYLLKYN